MLADIIEKCKPYFEKAVKISNEWDGTAFIYEDLNGWIYVASWNSWKNSNKDTASLICTIDGNSICFYDNGVLAEFISTSPEYRELLGGYIK